MRTLELVTTVAAGAFGAALAALTVGASLVLVLPAVVTVGAVSVVASRARSHR